MEWKQYKLGEVLTIKYGKDHKKLADGLIPVYGSGGIMRYADTCIYDKPSILIPRKGSLNNIFYVDKPFWTVDTMFWSMIDTNVVDPYFLYCAICKYDFAGLNVGSAVPSLTVPIIEAVELSLPPLPIQRRIAAILSSLDAQIENNNRINRNLEAQAQALFKSWFVDFEPWGGHMPEGWREGNINDLAEKLASGGTPKSMNSSYYEGDIKWYSTKELKDGFLIDSEKHISQEAYNNSATKMFPKETILMAIYAAPTVGRLGILTNDACFNQAAVGILPKKEIGYPFVYSLLLSERINLNNLACGAAQQNLNVGLVKNYTIIIPDLDIIKKYNTMAMPIFAQIRNNTEANARLASLRDTLLPKLMKGEIEV